MGLKGKKKQETGENYDLCSSEISIRMIKLWENGKDARMVDTGGGRGSDRILV